MEKIWLLGVVVALSVIGTSAQSPSSRTPMYLMLAPSWVHPGKETSLVITILSNDTLLPVTVTAKLTNGNATLVQAESNFRGGHTGILDLPPFNLSSVDQRYSFTLLVNGTQGGRLVFTNTTTLRFNPRTFTTVIQTDKQNYRPGDLVRIRVLSVQPDGKPKHGSVDLSIQDPKGGLIKTWMSLDNYLGVVSKEFSLSQTPPSGTWTVIATVNELITKEQFIVDYYDLPQFKVQVKTPQAIIMWDDLSGNVTAQHPNGQPVQGTLSVTATLVSALQNKAYPFIVLKTTKEIYWSARFLFMKDDLARQLESKDVVDSSQHTDKILQITACVTELSTGFQSNKTVVVHLIKNTYQLEFFNVPPVLKPSLPISTNVKISRYNNEPLTPADLLNSVLVDIYDRIPKSRVQGETFNDDSEEDSIEDIENYRHLALPVPADGVVHIEFQLQGHVEMLFIQATFMSSEESLELYSSNHSSPSGSYIQIKPPQVFPQIGKPLRLYIESTFQLTELHYLITSRGQVVSAGTANPSSFSVTPAVSWSPEVCIIVYCVQRDGEFINDAMHVFIKPAGVLKNQVSVSWSREKVRPGEEVSLTIHVLEPNSLVGIRLVSTEDEVTDITEREGTMTEHLHGMTRWKNSALSVFTASNLVVLTDASLHKTEDSDETEIDPMEEETFMIAGLRDNWRTSTGLQLSETLLWLDSNISDTRSLQVAVPDSMATWSAMAFVMSDNLGLGLCLKPEKLIVSKDFFLSLEIPECITRGEQLVLEVNLFNYLEQDLEVTVRVAENQSFQFVAGVNEHTVTLKSKCGATALFPIMPLVHGEITMCVKAQAGQDSEEIVRKMHVKPEGKEHSFSETLFLEVPPSRRNLSRQLLFSFPPNVVPGSQMAHVTVVGDVLGLSITDLASLVDMPQGCGEQNMIHFAPNVYVLQHLVQLNQSNEKIKSRALSFLMEGYQKELHFQRADGSFSAFGASDSAGSTWLTAFVLRCFLQAQTLMPVDGGVVTRAMVWLVKQQRSNGEFMEMGRVINTELQGGLDGPVSLAAYVLMTLMEDSKYASIFQPNVLLTKSYLEERVSKMVSSNYSLCLVAYSLALANSPVAAKALDELMARAEYKDDVPTWRSSSPEVSDSWQPRTAEIEMAAYVLLALHAEARIEEGFTLMKWLSEQRNHLGGYGSTQDTVVALKALTVYAALSGAQSIELGLEVSSSASPTVFHFNITYNNHLVNQIREIEIEQDLVIDVFMEGRGFAFLQLNVFYSVEDKVASEKSNAKQDHEGFSLDVNVIDDENDLDHINISIHTSLLASQMIAQTGMVLLEVDVLSGFTLAPESIAIGDVVKKVESSSGKVILYLDSLTTKEVHITLTLMRVFKVSLVQDAVVQVYDHYEPRRRAVRSYNSHMMENLNFCAFCGRECNLCMEQVLISGSSGASTKNRAIYCLGILPALIIALLLTTLYIKKNKDRASRVGGFCFHSKQVSSSYNTIN
ncbi:hypothetical protein UPYG_G00224960 [Umbra pygmaea]|uniref:Uncharacterized protein n=1 Tax=Umbra pygmaea TaxID=75934 RepID=A0ABD0WD84_UMBPY